MIDNGNGSFSATYTMSDSDTEGNITYSITNIKDLAGNSLEDINQTSSIVFDKTPPSFSFISITSDNEQDSNLYAIKDDTITLKFQPNG